MAAKYSCIYGATGLELVSRVQKIPHPQCFEMKGFSCDIIVYIKALKGNLEFEWQPYKFNAKHPLQRDYTKQRVEEHSVCVCM